MKDGELIGKVHNSVYQQCQKRGYAAPVDVFLKPRHPSKHPPVQHILFSDIADKQSYVLFQSALHPSFLLSSVCYITIIGHDIQKRYTKRKTPQPALAWHLSFAYFRFRSISAPITCSGCCFPLRIAISFCLRYSFSRTEVLPLPVCFDCFALEILFILPSIML